MKVTDSEIIKNGERELIDAITADLDWTAIEEIFLREHNLGIEEDIEYKNGDIIAVDNKIAYKLDFEVKVSLSILLDRNGDYLAVEIAGKKETTPPGEMEEPNSDLHPETDNHILKEADTSAQNHESVNSQGYEVENSLDNGNNTDNSHTDSHKDGTGLFSDISDENTDEMEQKVDGMLEDISKESRSS